MCGKEGICPQMGSDSLSEGEYLEKPGVDGIIVLNLSLKYGVNAWTILSVSEYRKMVGCCERGNENLSYIRH